MKKLKLIFIFSLFISALFAQQDAKLEIVPPVEAAEGDVKPESPWNLKGIVGLNLSQTALVNWSAGGENSVSGNVYLNGSLAFSKNRHYWETLLKTDYGLLWKQTDGLRKNSDVIDFSTSYGFKLDDRYRWYISAMAAWNTQYSKGYSYPNDSVYISKFMAPGYVNAALGVQYRLVKPTYNFGLLIAPIAARLTFVMDDSLSAAGAFGVEPGKTFRAQSGAQVKARISADVAKGLNLTSSLDLFSPYQKDFTVYVTWDFLLSYQIAKVFTITLSTSLVWNSDVHVFDGDLDLGPKLQFKEVLGLGVAYAF